MSHEERMQQLGRRATQQEPAVLALPRFVQASESVKPVSCVRHRIERHGWGEGRLPIPPDLSASVRTGEELDAQRQRLSVQRDVGPWSSPARKPQAAASPKRQQANPQLDAIKARVCAAKAFSQALMLHNAQQQQSARHSSAAGTSSSSSSSSSQGEAGKRCSSAGRQASGAVASLQAAAPKQPLVERHIPHKDAAQAARQQQQQQKQEEEEAAAAAVQHPAVAEEPAGVADAVLAGSSAAAAADTAAGAMALPAGLPDVGQLSAQVSRSSVAAAAGTDAPAAADADVATAAATPAAGQAAEQQVFDSAAATCRLLAFTQAAGASHGSAAAPQPAAAGGTVQQHHQQTPAQPQGPRAAAEPGSQAARPASSTGGSPHWSPVPPRMQLRQPRMVRLMDTHTADGQHEALGAAGQQQPPDSSSACRSRRVSLSSASPAAAAGGGVLQAQGSRRSAVGRASAAPAGFSNPELAAVQQVAKHRLVLPALCACGHGTSVLDPRYSQRCCSNCPLRGDAAAHERLLLGLLSSMT